MATAEATELRDHSQSEILFCGAEPFPIPEILRANGYVATIENFRGKSRRIEGLKHLLEIKPDLLQYSGVTFFTPRMVILTNELFRTFVDHSFSFQPEVKQGLIELTNGALELSATRQLSVRRSSWTTENPDPPGPRFNALSSPAKVLEAIKAQFSYCITQNWHLDPENEISLILQEFTDPPDVKISGDKLILSEEMPYHYQVPIGGDAYRGLDGKTVINVVPGDNRATSQGYENADSYVVSRNGTGRHIEERSERYKDTMYVDREGLLTPVKIPIELHIGTPLLDDFEILRIAEVIDALSRGGVPHRIEFSSGTIGGIYVVFINEALGWTPPPIPEIKKEPRIITGPLLKIINDRDDIFGPQGLKSLQTKKSHQPIIYISQQLCSNTTRLRSTLADLLKLQKRRGKEFIALYPGMAITEHAYKVISSDLGITSYPVPPSRRVSEGNLIQIETDGIRHTVTNLTLAGNESALCLQEYPKRLSSLEIGNKADGIRFLFSLGLPVPPTFVLTEKFFSSVIRTNGAGSLWANLTVTKEDIQATKQRIIKKQLSEVAQPGVEHPRTNDLTDREVLRIELQRRFEELRNSLQKIPKKEWAQFTTLRKNNLGTAPILSAVRSSGIVEDLSGRSFAGEFMTILGVTPKDLANAVLEVIRSPFTPEFAESLVKLPPNEGRRILASLSMPVIVMPLIDAECSGTLVHCHPTTHDPNYITIEAQYGIGGVVSAIRDASKEVLQIILSAETGKPVSIKSFSNGREEILPTLVQEMITAGEIEHLFRAAQLIHRHKGTPQDTEWAIERETRNAWFLQTRAA